MAYRIDSGIINKKFLSEIQRNEINKAFASLETCKQSHTATESKNLQQVYFNNVKERISELEENLKSYRDEIKKLERLKENMKRRYKDVKSLNSRSVEELSYGKTDRSRSRSRDREEEEIEEMAMKDCAASKGRSGLDGPSLRRFWDKQPNKDHFLEKAREKKAKTANSTGGKTQKKKCRHNRRLTQIKR